MLRPSISTIRRPPGGISLAAQTACRRPPPPHGSGGGGTGDQLLTARPLGRGKPVERAGVAVHDVLPPMLRDTDDGRAVEVPVRVVRREQQHVLRADVLE